mgnify:FL=1
MTENTNFSRHQNLFNTLHNMGYILLESELQEVVSAVEKDKMGSVNSKWKVGDVVRILDNFSCHDFEINDNVKLLRYDFEDEVWEAQGINGRWWISEKEGELV